MMTSESRFVIDTNLIVSAVLLKASPARRVFNRILERGVLLQSVATLEELTEVLNRAKFDKYISRSERLQFLAVLLRDSTLIEITTTIRVCRDPKDDKFLELAVSGQAEAIVTGDNDLLVLHPYGNVSIVSPATFLNP